MSDDGTCSHCSDITVPDTIYKLEPVPPVAGRNALIVCGSLTFGRGQDTGVTDRRVSRTHAQFDVSSPDNTLSVTPNGQLPLHRLDPSGNWARLPVRVTCALKCGDVIAMLPPNTCQYTVSALDTPVPPAVSPSPPAVGATVLGSPTGVPAPAPAPAPPAAAAALAPGATGAGVATTATALCRAPPTCVPVWPTRMEEEGPTAQEAADRAIASYTADPETLTLKELKSELAAWGLDKKGDTRTLRARLLDHITKRAAERAAFTETPEDPPRASARFATAPVPRKSEEFWALEEKVMAAMQGRNDDYVRSRLEAGLKPVTFTVKAARAVQNDVLSARFEAFRARLGGLVEAGERTVVESRERISFHGTHPRNVDSLLRASLLRFRHPLNPCRAQSDEGWFGANTQGVYVSRYIDYTLKYANGGAALVPGDTVSIVVFRTLPGRTKRLKATGAVPPTPGYDSHSSTNFLEWYLFSEDQALPAYVVDISAVQDTRTAADDGEGSEEDEEDDDAD